MLKFLKKKKAKLFEQVKETNDSANNVSYELLEEKDILNKFAIDYKLYLKFLDARGIKKPGKSFDTRVGFYIDGSEINTEHHEYHNYLLKEKETGKLYVVDTVSYLWHFGQYISLAAREVGTKSHRIIICENINCRDHTILEAIKEFKIEFEMIKQ